MIVDTVELDATSRGWFTGRAVGETDPPVGRAGNLAHRRPHRPADLARARERVAERVGVPSDRWHLLRQVHGADVAVVDAATPPGAELEGVDAVVTALPDRVLAVQTADCVPVLLAGASVVGAAHAGRRGIELGVLGATVAAMTELGAGPADLVAMIGPAIGGCCYEIPAELQRGMAGEVPDAAATTTWGTPSLDLRLAASSQLASLGIQRVGFVGGCTRCDPSERWFSHRADPAAGRQLAMVVRQAPAIAHGGAGGC